MKRIVSLAIIFAMLLTMFTFPVTAAEDEIIVAAFNSTDTAYTYSEGVLSDDYAVLGEKSLYLNGLGTGVAFMLTLDDAITYGDYKTINMLIYNPETEKTGLGFLLGYADKDGGDSTRASSGSVLQYFEPGWQLVSGTISTKKVGDNIKKVYIRTTQYDLKGTDYPYNHVYDSAHHADADGNAMDACTCAGTTEGHCVCSSAVGTSKIGKKSLYIAGVWLSKGSPEEMTSTPSLPSGSEDISNNLKSYRITFSKPIISSSVLDAVKVYDGETEITEGISKTAGADYVDIAFADGTLKTAKTYTVKVADTAMGHRGNPYQGAEYTFTTRAFDTDAVTSITTLSEGDVIEAGSDVILGAEVSTSSDVSHLEFWANGEKLPGVIPGKNGTMIWYAPKAGSYQITAKAILSSGYSVASLPVNVVVERSDIRILNKFETISDTKGWKNDNITEYTDFTISEDVVGLFSGKSMYDKELGSVALCSPAMEADVTGGYSYLNILVYNPEETDMNIGYRISYTGDGSTPTNHHGAYGYLTPGYQLITLSLPSKNCSTKLINYAFNTKAYKLQYKEYPNNHYKTEASNDHTCSENGCNANYSSYLNSKSIYYCGAWLSTTATPTAITSAPSIADDKTGVSVNTNKYRITFSDELMKDSHKGAVTVKEDGTAITGGVSYNYGTNYVDVVFADGTLKADTEYTISVSDKVKGYAYNPYAATEYSFTTAATDADVEVDAKITYPADNSNISTNATFVVQVENAEKVEKVEFINADTSEVIAEAVATSNGEYVAADVTLAAEQTHSVKAAVTLNDGTVVYSDAITVVTASSNDYMITGIADGDHIVVAAEPSRKIKVIDATSSTDPDDLKAQTASNVGWVDFKIDGEIVKTIKNESAYEYNLEFGTDYGEHTLAVDVYDNVGYMKSYGPFTYTTLADTLDDTFLTFSENFDGDTDGKGLHGGTLNLPESIVDGALQLGDGATKSVAAMHPFGRTIPKDNEVYYMEFDLKTTDTSKYHTRVQIRDGYQSGTSAIVFNFSKVFNSNQFYKIKIVFDFYSNYATSYVDGEYYSRISMAEQTGGTFIPELFVNMRTATIDNFKFSAYGYRAELPEPTYSDEKPVIIFKYDDLGRAGAIAGFNKVAYLMDKYDATGGFGIVGDWYLDQDDSEKETVANATKEYIADGIEIWHHGYLHSTTEYRTDDYDTQKENFGKNMELVKEEFGITMHSFGSPYNHATETTLKMIKENYPEITNVMCLDNDPNNVATIPKFNNRCSIELDTGIIGSEQFITNFESKRSDPYLLVQSHPGYWDDGELSEFELILRYLNASGVTYMTPTQAAEDYVANKTYKFVGIEEGDRIVAAKESSRKIRLIDSNDYTYNPVGLANAKATMVSSVDFIVDGEVAYTAEGSAFEYDLPFNDFGVHTIKAVVHETAGTTKTYGPYTYTILDATIDGTLTVEEDFTTSQDASAIHGGVYGSGLSFAVENGVLKATATNGSYTMNLHPSADKLSVQDRIYFMEYDFKIDSNAYQTRLYMNDATADGFTRTALNVTKDYDIALNTWYNVKVMIDPGNNEAITYINNNEYKRIALTHLVKENFIPELMVNRKNVFLDNYKFYAYDLTEKAEATNPVVILRFDDLKPGVTDAFESAIAVLDKYDIGASCGVIGHQLGDADLYEAIKTFHQNGAEIWSHGYEHTGTEFQGATAESVVENFAKTLNLIKENCDIDITSFCAGYNNTDSVAVKAIQENFPQIKAIMSSEDALDAATTVVNLRATTTFEGGTDTSSKIDIDGFKASYETLKHNEYVVIYCHPGSWKTADFDKFDEIIQYLLEDGATFMQPTKAAEHYNSIYRNPDTHIAKLAVNDDGLLYLSSKNVPETSTVYVAVYDNEDRFMYATTLTFENGIAQERIDLTGAETVKAFVLDDETVAPDCDTEDYQIN